MHCSTFICHFLLHTTQVVEVQARTGRPHLHSVAWAPLEEEENEDEEAEGDRHSNKSDHTELLGRLQDNKHVPREELEPLVQLGAGAITVCLCPDDLQRQFPGDDSNPGLSDQQAERVCLLAQTMQRHTCTPSCTTAFVEGQECRFWSPWMPCLFPLIATCPNGPGAEEKLKAMESIHRRVQSLLREQRHTIDGGPFDEEVPREALIALLRQVDGPPVGLEGGAFAWAGAVFPLTRDLIRLQFIATQLGAIDYYDTILLAVYHDSLSIGRLAKYLPRRTVAEAWVVNYNPYIMLTWQANHEIKLVTHTPHKLFQYITKGSRQHSVHLAITELVDRGRPGDIDAARCMEKLVQHGQREVSLAEAMYRLDSRLNYTSTSPGINVVWVPTNPAVASFLKTDYSNRPANLEYTCLYQFLQWYRRPKSGEEYAKPQEKGQVDIIVPNDDRPVPQGYSTLPSMIHLTDGRLMRRLRKPRVVDWDSYGDYNDIVMFQVK